MGAELILLSYAVGLIPIVYGLIILVVGRVRLGPWSRGPIRGTMARLVGLGCWIAAFAYHAAINRAWSIYDR